MKNTAIAMNRTGKIKLLTQIIEGKLNEKQFDDLRRSREPMYITMNLGNDDGELELGEGPSYHIEIYDDWRQHRCYWRYPDGKIEEVFPNRI